MIGAALDTRRRALGLSIEETAERIGVEARLVNRWIAGEREPRDPGEVLERLHDLEESMEELLDRVIGAATDATASGPVRLLRYRSQADLDAAMATIGAAHLRLPLGAHAILIAWADDQLAAQGIDTVIEWMTQDAHAGALR